MSRAASEIVEKRSDVLIRGTARVCVGWDAGQASSDAKGETTIRRIK
jgi:hypothetical protein